jgi:hypothetical protein
MLCFLLAAAAKAVNDSEAFRERQHAHVQIGAQAANVPFISVANASRCPMPTMPTPDALVAITTGEACGTVGGATAVIIALHPGVALREVINADRNDGGMADAKSAYRQRNWFTLRPTSGLEFTTTADGFNVTEHRSAPASVEVIAATKSAQSLLQARRHRS